MAKHPLCATSLVFCSSPARWGVPCFAEDKQCVGQLSGLLVTWPPMQTQVCLGSGLTFYSYFPETCGERPP